MNETRARKILGDTIQRDNSLSNVGKYLYWSEGEATLDGDFDLEDLEAIVWWMKNMPVKK